MQCASQTMGHRLGSIKSCQNRPSMPSQKSCQRWKVTSCRVFCRRARILKSQHTLPPKIQRLLPQWQIHRNQSPEVTLDLLQHMKYVTGSLATTLSPRNIPVPDTRVMSFPEKTSPLQTIPETNIPVPNSLVPNTAVRNSPDMAAANSGASDADYADHADKDEGTSFIPEERRGCPL